MNRKQRTVLLLRSISVTMGFMAGFAWSSAKNLSDPTIFWAGVALSISVLAAMLEPT